MIQNSVQWLRALANSRGEISSENDEKLFLFIMATPLRIALREKTQCAYCKAWVPKGTYTHHLQYKCPMRREDLIPGGADF